MPYKSPKKVIRAKAPKAKNFTNRQCKWKHFIDQAKNGNRVFVTAASANILLGRYTLLGAVRPQ